MFFNFFWLVAWLGHDKGQIILIFYLEYFLFDVAHKIVEVIL